MRELSRHNLIRFASHNRAARAVIQVMSRVFTPGELLRVASRCMCEVKGGRLLLPRSTRAKKKEGKMIARKVCLHAGLIAVMSACLVTNGKGDISGLGISDDATVGFVWSANSEPDLAGYKLYVGTLPGIYSGYVDVGPATSFQLFDLIRGTTYHFALTAYNSGGLESGFTPELTKQVPLVITNGVFTLDPAMTNSPTPIDLSGITNTTISPETLPLEVTRIPDQRVAKNGIS